jgi:hypothetical protein
MLMTKVYILLFLLLFLIQSPPVAVAQGGFGTLEGTVADMDGRPISGASIKLVGTQGRFETLTNGSGAFSTSLPVGKYSMRAWGRGFYDVGFANIEIARDKKARFNITLVYYELARLNLFKAGMSTTLCTCAKPPTFERRVRDDGQTFVIVFGEKSVSEDGSIEYSGVPISYGDCDRVEKEAAFGPLSKDRILQPYVQNGTTVVWADSIREKENKIEFFGNITVDENGTRLNLAKYLIDSLK